MRAPGDSGVNAEILGRLALLAHDLLDKMYAALLALPHYRRLGHSLSLAEKQ